MIISIAILFALNWFGKYMCDLIKFKPHLFGSDWMLAVGKYSYDKRGILRKGILSFLSDDYYINHNRWLAISLLILGFYIYHGLIFEIVYFILS